MRKKTKRKLAQSWGYLLFVFVIFGWWNPEIGPLILVVASIAALLYFLFQAPVWCGARNRNDTTHCRNNSTGLFLGCHLKQHKWQRLKMLAPGAHWLRANRALWTGVRECLTTVAAVATVFSAVIAGIQYAVVGIA